MALSASFPVGQMNYFADFSKAFDGIIRERVWEIMGQYDIPEIFIRTFKVLYHKGSGYVTEGEGILAGLK